MPLESSAIKSKFQSRIHAGLQREFGNAVAEGKNYPGVADEFWVKLANAISDIAMDLVDEIHNNAQVVPGQQVTGTAVGAAVSGPVTGATASPGKIV